MSSATEALIRSKHFLISATIYGLLIIYGSLFPFDQWQKTYMPLLGFLQPEFDKSPIFTDLVLNTLVYMPLGFLLVMGLRRFLSIFSALLVGVLIGGILSFILEILQNYIPARVSSLSDLITNLLGTTLGGILAAILQPDMPLGYWLWQWRQKLFRPDILGALGLAAFGLWSLSQLSPLVPSLDVGNLRQGLAPLLQALTGQLRFDTPAALSYALNLIGLGLLTIAIARPHIPVIRLFLAGAFIVLLVKVPVVSRQLSLEALTGWAGAALLLPLLRTLPLRSLATIAAASILGGFALVVLPASGQSGALLYPFNWIPFRGDMPNIRGLAGILENLWPFFALAVLVRLATPPRLAFPLLWLGVGLIAGLTGGVEWYQQFQPGRYPDITDILLPVAAWMLAGWLAARKPIDPALSPPALDAAPRVDHRHSGALAAGLGIALFGAILIVAARIPAPSSQQPPRLDVPLLPDLQALPVVVLPNLRLVHPRLPAPAPSEIRRLETENPNLMIQ